MKKIAPSKAETSLLAPFPGLLLEQIVVPLSKAECDAAAQEILAAGIAGFDTESKPTFDVGAISAGPHVLQFALHDKAYIFQLHQLACREAVVELLRSEQLLKVGFDLKSDHQQIYQRLGVRLGAVLDLNQVFRHLGYSNSMGARAAVGVVLQQNFRKSKHVTTSNWSLPQLTPRQLLYAANDAYAALKVFEALNLPRQDLPITGLSESYQGA